MEFYGGQKDRYTVEKFGIDRNGKMRWGIRDNTYSCRKFIMVYDSEIDAEVEADDMNHRYKEARAVAGSKWGKL